MVLDQEDAVKAERLGLADVIDVVGIDAAVAGQFAGIGARAAEQSEPHFLHLSLLKPRLDLLAHQPQRVHHPSCGMRPPQFNLGEDAVETDFVAATA